MYRRHEIVMQYGACVSILLSKCRFASATQSDASVSRLPLPLHRKLRPTLLRYARSSFSFPRSIKQNETDKCVHTKRANMFSALSCKFTRSLLRFRSMMCNFSSLLFSCSVRFFLSFCSPFQCCFPARHRLAVTLSPVRPVAPSGRGSRASRSRDSHAQTPPLLRPVPVGLGGTERPMLAYSVHFSQFSVGRER